MIRPYNFVEDGTPQPDEGRATAFEVWLTRRCAEFAATGVAAFKPEYRAAVWAADFAWAWDDYVTKQTQFTVRGFREVFMPRVVSRN